MLLTNSLLDWACWKQNLERRRQAKQAGVMAFADNHCIPQHLKGLNDRYIVHHGMLV